MTDQQMIAAAAKLAYEASVLERTGRKGDALALLRKSENRYRDAGLDQRADRIAAARAAIAATMTTPPPRPTSRARSARAFDLARQLRSQAERLDDGLHDRQVEHLDARADRLVRIGFAAGIDDRAWTRTEA